MALGAFVLAMVSAGGIYEYQDSVDGAHLPPVDAVVVLAGGRGRIAAAGDIWYRYWEQSLVPPEGREKLPSPVTVPVLYLSGMGQKSTFSTVVRQVRRGVVEVLRPEHVIVEAQSLNTEENAEFVSRFARERGWTRILLVTSPYHMKRAIWIFDRVLESRRIPLRIETLSAFQEPFEPGEWMAGFHGIRVTLIEYLKFLYYRTAWKPTS
jgi:uncharacterized SAM-binding protein YcdF (DUF218 family)